MTMLRPGGKAYQIAKKIMKEKGKKVPPPKAMEKFKLRGPYLQH